MDRYLNGSRSNSEVHGDMRELLEKNGITRTYKKGAVIYHQGDYALSFCYLKKGRVKVFMTSVDGMERILNTASTGELLGEGAFFDRKPRVSSAVAAEDSELIIINEQQLTRLIQKYPKVAFELLEILANRIRLLSSQLDSMTFKQADARIARLLIESETDGRVNLTHEEIAGAVGVSRVTVSKILGCFATEGLISTEYGYVNIKDSKRLVEISV